MINLLIKLLNLYELIIILRVLFSWLMPYETRIKNKFIMLIFNATDYPLKRIKSNLRTDFRNFDFSPIILFVFIELFKYILLLIRNKGV